MLFFHSGCAQQCADIPFVVLRHLHLLSVFPLMMAILTGISVRLSLAFPGWGVERLFLRVRLTLSQLQFKSSMAA